jgi:putative acetyltransferase
MYPFYGVTKCSVDTSPWLAIPLDTKTMNPSVQISQVDSAEALDAIRVLFKEYWDSFGFTPCFQNFGEELAGLPGAYSPPTGRLALVKVDDQPAGCIALRRIDSTRAEPKRLYVRPAFRGQGIGRGLLEWVMNEARKAGYSELIGDTMPVMRGALALYERMRFEIREPVKAAQPASISQVADSPIVIRIKL